MNVVIELPWRAVPKARPRVTSRGTYMPPKYRAWKEDVAELIQMVHPRVTLEKPVLCVVRFGSESTRIELTEYEEEYQRAKYVTGDVDNLAGSVLDSLQDSGIITNDRQVVRLDATIEPR